MMTGISVKLKKYKFTYGSKAMRRPISYERSIYLPKSSNAVSEGEPGVRATPAGTGAGGEDAPRA
jgi:hypothetical protein